MSRRWLAVALSFIALGVGSVSLADTSETRMTSSAQPGPVLGMNVPAQKNFDFGTLKAWLRSDGSWEIHGMVEHTGLLCAEYEVGLRFGKGTNGCNDVIWIGDPVFVTQKTQCNSAPVEHRGGDVDPGLGHDFADITCAERVTRCTGRCIGGS